MKIDFVDSCCTAKIISYLEPAEAVGSKDQYPGTDIGDTEEALLKTLKDEKLKGNAMVIAFSNNKQKKANKMLKKLGFKSTRWATKTKHSQTKLKLWWFALDKLEA
jgi:hypothetical protein